MIPVYKPFLPEKSLTYAHEALNSGWLSSGDWIQKTTQKLKEILKIEYLLLVNNGTAANHLLVKAARKKYPDYKKIIIPNNVYIAAVNCWLFDNEECEIEIVSPNENTWNLDITNLKDEKAFVQIVHNLGNIINIPNLQKKYKNLIFVEDNCEGLFGKYNSQYSGTASFASTISFFGNKNITCGEGGAIILSDKDSYEYVKCLHGQGQSRTRFIHSEVGYNYRLTNIQAAILYGQLDFYKEILEKKKEIFDRYEKFCQKYPEYLISQQAEKFTSHSNWMFGCQLNYKNSEKDHYPEMEKFFWNWQIEIRPMFYDLRFHDALKDKTKQWKINFCDNESVSKNIHNHSVILPSFPDLTIEEQNNVLKVMESWIKECTHKGYL